MANELLTKTALEEIDVAIEFSGKLAASEYIAGPPSLQVFAARSIVTKQDTLTEDGLVGYSFPDAGSFTERTFTAKAGQIVKFEITGILEAVPRTEFEAGSVVLGRGQNSTQVIARVKKGTSGKSYTLQAQVTTNLGKVYEQSRDILIL